MWVLLCAGPFLSDVPACVQGSTFGWFLQRLLQDCANASWRVPEGRLCANLVLKTLFFSFCFFIKTLQVSKGFQNGLVSWCVVNVCQNPSSVQRFPKLFGLMMCCKCHQMENQEELWNHPASEIWSLKLHCLSQVFIEKLWPHVKCACKARRGAHVYRLARRSGF